MRRFLKKVAGVLENAFAVGELLAFAGAVIMFFVLLGQALQPLSPIITALVLLGFTVHALSSGKLNAVSVLIGLVIYGLAWPVTHQYGTLFGMTVWTIGLVLWLVAVTRSFPRVWTAVTA